MRLSCSVCLEEATDNSELVSLSACGHVFDAECIAQCILLSNKCPLCNQSIVNSHPVYKRVYFSALEGDGNDGKDALSAAKEELEAAKDTLDKLNQEYDDLALKWTVAKDDLSTINREKTQLEDDNAIKNAQIDKLTHNWQTSKARNKDDVDNMNLKLITKQKSIDLLNKNLDKSNKRIKSLKEELDTFKPQNTQGNAPRYRDQNFKVKYQALDKEHKALKDKMGQLEKKFIDLTLISPSLLPPSSSLPSQTEEALQAKIQQLERQLQTSATKENTLLKEVMRFKQLKQDAMKEKEDLQAKLANAEAAIASLEHGTKMDDTPREEAGCDTLPEEV